MTDSVIANTASASVPSSWTLFIIITIAAFAVYIAAIFIAGKSTLIRSRIIKATEKGRRETKYVQWPVLVIIALIAFLAGGFFVWSSAFATILMAAVIVYIRPVKGDFTASFNDRTLTALILVFFYAVSILWARDKGEAIQGAVKYIPLLLFAVILDNYPESLRKKAKDIIPLSGAVMTVLSGILMLIAPIRPLLTVNGRLAGFFQYPNTYALFLLAGLLILSYSTAPIGFQIPAAAVLAVGIIMSGSRTTYIVAAVVFVIRIITAEKGSVRKKLIICAAVLAAAAVIAAFLMPESAAGRLFRISFTSSQLLGRLIYFRDALVQIIRHPMGLGYMGFYYSQGSFQSGVYSVMFVHNGLLQLLIDVGWIPGLAIAFLLIRNICSKSMKWSDRIVIIAVLIHSMLDFDSEFISVWIILMICMSNECTFKKLSDKKLGTSQLLEAVMFSLSVSLGAASFAGIYADPYAALKLYPDNTAALIQVLSDCDDLDIEETLAIRISELDDYVSIAHSAMADAAYARGDIPEMIVNKEKAIACAGYVQEEYNDYFNKLYNAAMAYETQGSLESRDYCITKLMSIPDMIDEVYDKTCGLSFMTRDKPDIELTEDNKLILQKLSEMTD